MPYYQAPKISMVGPRRVPDGVDLAGVEWRWIDEKRGYFQTKTKLQGVKSAPKNYPNGVPLDGGEVITDWETGIVPEADPLEMFADEEVRKSARRRGLIEEVAREVIRGQ